MCETAATVSAAAGWCERREEGEGCSVQGRSSRRAASERFNNGRDGVRGLGWSSGGYTSDVGLSCGGQK